MLLATNQSGKTSYDALLSLGELTDKTLNQAVAYLFGSNLIRNMHIQPNDCYRFRTSFEELEEAGQILGEEVKGEIQTAKNTLKGIHKDYCMDFSQFHSESGSVVW